MPKKSRNDIIRAAVGYYLRNKGYVGDRFRKSEIVLLQNRREFMFQSMQAFDLERGNNFTYSNHTITNGQQISEQFARFTQFVELQTECVRLELRRFYAPMLCHLYIDLLKAREHKAAVEFLKKFAHLVANVETYDVATTTTTLPTKINGSSMPIENNATETSPNCANLRFVRNPSDAFEDAELNFFVNLLQILSTCTQIEAAENDLEIAKFRASKYEIHTTAAVAEALNSYLEKRGHVVILNLLHSWLQVHIVDNEQSKWTEDSIFFGGTLDDDMEDECLTPKPGVKIKTEPGVKSSTKRSASSVQAPIEIKTEQSDISDDNDSKKWFGRNVPMCLDTLRCTREQILKSKVAFPHFIKVADKTRGLTSADLDANECHMVAGFNSSTVQLWQLNQQRCSGKNLYGRRANTTCRWEINNCCKEEEDAIDLDIQTHASSNDDREKRKFYEGKYEDNSYNEYGGIKLRGHGLGVTDVRFSTHYPLIYSVSKDTTMRSWHADSYNCAAIYRGHRYPIWCFDESPMGMYMATGSKDLTARLWSTEREYPLITFIGHTQDVDCVAFHPNGNYIATGSHDLTVRLWCTTSGKVMRVFADKQAVTCLAFSPDGKFLAAAGEETKVRIFDLAAGAQISELKDHSTNVTSIAWNHNGRQLATVCRDGSLRVWDTKRLLTHDTSGSSSTSNTTSPSSSSSSSSSSNRLLTLNSSNCQRLVKVFFARNEAVCCIGC